MVTKRSAISKSAKASAPKSAAKRHRNPADPVIAGENPAHNVSTEDIARLAYALWQARGGQNGSPEEDWIRAEQELIGKL